MPEMSTFMKKEIKYGDKAFSFVFPTPTIITTVSYWDGNYPSITGPDWTSLPLTTRLAQDTPLPSFQLFTSTPTATGFRTVVTSAAASVYNSVRAVAPEVAVAAEPLEPGSEPVLCGESGRFLLNFDDQTVHGGGLDLLPVSDKHSDTLDELY
jgi:hypothetical protein